MCSPLSLHLRWPKTPWCHDFRYRQRQQGAGDRVSGFLGQAAKSYAGNFKDEDHTEAEIAWDLDGGFKHGLRTFFHFIYGMSSQTHWRTHFFKMVIAPPTRYLWQRLDILWMEDILHHLTDGWNPMNNGINHLSTGAGFLPSTVLSWYLEVSIIMIQGHNLFGAPYSKVLGLKSPLLVIVESKKWEDWHGNGLWRSMFLRRLEPFQNDEVLFSKAFQLCF